MNWLADRFPSLFSPDASLLALAREARWLPPWWIVLPLTAAIVLAAQLAGGTAYFIGAAALGAIDLPQGGGTPQQSDFLPRSAPGFAALLVLAFAGIYALLLPWARFVERRGLHTLGFTGPRAYQKLILGAVLALALFSLTTLSLAPFGLYVLEATPFAWTGALLLLLGWSFQGSAEELLLRGWILPVLGARYNAIVGVVISSAAFAILHGLNPNIGPIAILNLALFGVFTALYALREGSILGVCALHSIWNWSQTNLYGLSTSGMRIEAGLLLDWDERGPDWLTGGAFGPEGGIMASVVLLGAIAWILMRAYVPGKSDHS